MSDAAAIVAQDVGQASIGASSTRTSSRTLKSALLTGSLLSDLTPDETFTALDGRLLRGAAGLDLRRDRRERLGQVDAARSSSPASPSPRAAASPSTAASRP